MERDIITMNEYGRVMIPTSTKAERYIRLPDGYGMDVYALSMVVALAFRINTPCARRVRKALLERLYGQKERQVLWVSMNRPMLEC